MGTYSDRILRRLMDETRKLHGSQLLARARSCATIEVNLVGTPDGDSFETRSVRVDFSELRKRPTIPASALKLTEDDYELSMGPFYAEPYLQSLKDEIDRQLKDDRRAPREELTEAFCSLSSIENERRANPSASLYVEFTGA